MKRLALSAALLGVMAPAAASAQTETATLEPPADMTLREFVPKRWTRLHWTNRTRANRCRPALHFVRSSREILPWRRQDNLAYWRDRNRRNKLKTCSVHRAIRWFFGARWPEARNVAECESHGWSRPHGARFAVNGRFVGVLQMGDSERRAYGWYTVGAPAKVQIASGHAYFVASGSDWSPWECQP